jgi:hypothetical protein
MRSSEMDSHQDSFAPPIIASVTQSIVTFPVDTSNLTVLES